jgi:2-desacetyl-2-hydroxyethyl bacteriochlorophyllide A dehydrogenase
MRAVVARQGAVHVEIVDEPAPGAGQVVVRSLANGICGSDLHVLEVQRADPVVLPSMVLGHEFCAELLDHGPDTTRQLAPGTLVCSVPFVDGPQGPELVGLSATYPGALGERFLLQEHRLLPVPDGLDAQRAALTEPVAVGVHAVAAAQLDRDDVALVIGCGPIGLAAIAALKLAGHGPVVASDFSPFRRSLAERTGADVVVDPADTNPYASWLELAGAPLPPSPLMETAELRSLRRASTVVFDCVGAPGLLAQHVQAMPQHSRLIVVGVCAAPDTFVPVEALNKELAIQFVFAYRPEEFAASLHHIADGRIDVGPWITDICALDDAAAAFDDLSSGGPHCKVLIEPGRASSPSV